MTEDNDDRLYYRRAVSQLMKDNKDKYPTVNEAILHSFLQGTISMTAILLGESIDAAFALNLPIAECARMLEETCAFAKVKAEEMYRLMKMEGNTIH